MKHLKLFESFKEEDIHAICEKYGIENYTINEDGSIDVDGNIEIWRERFTKLPIKFRNIYGDFDCSENSLTTLEGCPTSISGNFICSYNKLTSLEDGPKSVGGDFHCEFNLLTSLEGCPESVGDDFYCQCNKIVTFEHTPFSIGDDFYCYKNPIYQVWKLFEDYSKIEFLNDCDALRAPDSDYEEPIIILDRLNFFLEEIGKKPVDEVKGYKCI